MLHSSHLWIVTDSLDHWRWPPWPPNRHFPPICQCLCAAISLKRWPVDSSFHCSPLQAILSITANNRSSQYHLIKLVCHLSVTTPYGQPYWLHTLVLNQTANTHLTQASQVRLSTAAQQQSGECFINTSEIHPGHIVTDYSRITVRKSSSDSSVAAAYHNSCRSRPWLNDILTYVTLTKGLTFLVSSWPILPSFYHLFVLYKWNYYSFSQVFICSVEPQRDTLNAPLME